MANEKGYGKIAEILRAEPGILLRGVEQLRVTEKKFHAVVSKHHILCICSPPNLSSWASCGR